jgi:hypothetical protein
MHKGEVPERIISFGSDLAAVPERLLLSHARGQVLFIAGAGISRPAGLPNFRDLVVKVYARVDPAAHEAIASIPETACNQWLFDASRLTDAQSAEVRRFVLGDYDVVLGMLERRIDGHTAERSSVRQAVASELVVAGIKPAAIHRALMRLSDRGGTVTIITTNFDCLLEDCAKSARPKIQTYSLGGIPRPGYRSDFGGVLHIHGCLPADPARTTDLILSDQDFGEFYLRRRTIADFIYDAARLYNLVLVGYSANDPPMRYLLNAVAADGTRFNDLKERFTFVGANAPDPVKMEDWRARGITPIQYGTPGGDHNSLTRTLEKWAEFSAINGDRKKVDAEIRRIVRTARSTSVEADRDLFDHFIRRSNANERNRLSALSSKFGADVSWLDAIIEIAAEHQRDTR